MTFKTLKSALVFQLVGAAIFVYSVGIAAENPEASPLDRVDRVIGRQPAYKSAPRYALLVFGTNADSKVWIVEDGKTLYVDKNANGDLTDDGPPLLPEELKEWKRRDGGTSFQFGYYLKEISPVGGSKHSDFCLRRWNYGDEADRYALSATLDERVPMYAGWFGTFWAALPRDVPLVHFGGPLTPKLMRFKELPIGSKGKRLSVGLFNSGRGEGATSRLDIYALPSTAKLSVEIDWPVGPGAASVKTSTTLTERCCYWEFYNPSFDAPDGIVPGIARATFSVADATFPFDLVTNHFEFPVIAENLKTESR